eukprot:2377377-Rhodomonas_salina.1
MPPCVLGHRQCVLVPLCNDSLGERGRLVHVGAETARSSDREVFGGSCWGVTQRFERGCSEAVLRWRRGIETQSWPRRKGVGHLQIRGPQLLFKRA